MAIANKVRFSNGSVKVNFTSVVNLDELEDREPVAIANKVRFSDGSVKVRFRVVVNTDELEDKDPVAIVNKVGKILRNSGKTGQIGNLKVKQTAELRGLYCGFDVTSFAHCLNRSLIHRLID